MLQKGVHLAYKSFLTAVPTLNATLRMNAKKKLSIATEKELASFFNSFDEIFCDVDGVVWPFNGTINNGIKETFTKLTVLNKKIHFITHNNLIGTEKLHMMLRELVPKLKIEDVVTSMTALIHYLEDINFNKEIFYIGYNSNRKILIEAGFKVISQSVEEFEEDIPKLLDQVPDNKNIGAVIVDFDPNINYMKIVTAIHYLQRKDVLFLSAPSMMSIKLDNRILLGSQAFQHVIEQISGRLADSFGKPSHIMKQYIFKKYNISDASRYLIVGDSLNHDIQFGKMCGFKTLLVGNDDLEKSQIIPDYCIDSLGNLHK